MNFENEHIAIYELNNNSMLFARVAAEFILKGETDRAKEILLEGIQKFEEYPTPYFLYGNLLLQDGEFAKAKGYYKQGNEFLNNSETLEFYLNKIPIKEQDDIDVTEKTDSHIEFVTDKNNNEILENKSEDLEELADKLHTAKIIVNSNELPPLPDESEKNETEEFKPVRGLVSETLATIYFNQSNYKEAKAIYETLIEIQPEREEYFRERIKEIESRMRPRKTDE
jgi:tetratricopeptide (TPR) repeat protein